MSLVASAVALPVTGRSSTEVALSRASVASVKARLWSGFSWGIWPWKKEFPNEKTVPSGAIYIPCKFNPAHDGERSYCVRTYRASYVDIEVGIVNI